jgi:fatty acid desaturase
MHPPSQGSVEDQEAGSSTPEPAKSTRRAGDEYECELPVRLDPAEIRRLSRLSPWRSSAHIALEWALVFGAATLCWKYWHPALYVVTVAFIGARQHALMLLAHDAAHWRLFRSRALNDWAGEAFLAWPLVLFSMQAYRQNHLPHHRSLNTEGDPDWVRKQTPDWEFPMKPGQLARMLVMDALGIGFVRFMILMSRMPKTAARKPAEGRALAVARLAFLLATAVTLTALHAWKFYLLFFVVPFVTWLQLVFHVRSIAEHFAIPRRPGIHAGTRTVLTSWFDRLFVVSKNGNHHLEHHLFPSVPFYRLPELHRLLMEQPAFRDRAYLTQGYWGVLRDCVTVKRAESPIVEAVPSP